MTYGIVAQLRPVRIDTSVGVDAPPATVWEVLTDTAAYSEWNPFIVRADGRFAADTTVHLTLPGADGSDSEITPRVLVVEPERELRWRGRLFLPGIFDGEYGFELTPLDDGRRTRVAGSETFSGIAVPPAAGWLRGDVHENYVALNTALAARAARHALAER